VNNSLSLSTTNCIVSGRPAKLWTGHVLARVSGPVDGDGRVKFFEIGVIAGFVDEVTMLQVKSNKFGCYGNWKEADGLAWAFGNRPSERVWS